MLYFETGEPCSDNKKLKVQVDFPVVHSKTLPPVFLQMTTHSVDKATELLVVYVPQLPTGIQFPIPGNDDARRSINLYCSLLKETILNAKNEAPTNIEEKPEVKVKENADKTIKEIDREKLDAKFAKKNKPTLN